MTAINDSHRVIQERSDCTVTKGPWSHCGQVLDRDFNSVITIHFNGGWIENVGGL